MQIKHNAAATRREPLRYPLLNRSRCGATEGMRVRGFGSLAYLAATRTLIFFVTFLDLLKPQPTVNPSPTRKATQNKPHHPHTTNVVVLTQQEKNVRYLTLTAKS